MRYDELSETEKLELKVRAQKSTLIDVWGELAPVQADNWSPRAQIAAEMLHGVSSVADIGCGLMTLKKYLPKDVQYIPVDCISRSEDTIVVDLNQKPLPPIMADAAAALGLMEYLFDVSGFLQQLLQFEISVITYNLSDSKEAYERPTMWVNALTRHDIESLFQDAGPAH